MQAGRRLPCLITSPATNSPIVPVVQRHPPAPLHVTRWRVPVMPVILTCSRSTDESTYRTAPPRPIPRP
jgi:hypothetical protein